MSDAPPARPGPSGGTTLAAIVTAAVEATGSTAGWLVEPGTAGPGDGRADGLVVVAAHGGSPEWAASLVGRPLPTDGATAALVVQSGQPVALQPGSGALHDAVALALLGRPPVSLVCVPCTAGERTTGALQLVDKTDGGPFDFDDVELATVLGGIAGVALADGSAAAAHREVTSPARLAEQLARLAEVDPDRYTAATVVIEALLA